MNNKKEINTQIKKDEDNDNFFNIYSAIILLLIIVSSICLLINNKIVDNDIRILIAFLFIISLFIMVLYVISHFRITKMKKNINNLKDGKIKWLPYTIDRATFIEECKTGLIYSIVRIDGKIYELETQIDNIKSPKYDKFICYINENEIIGLDNFLNYKYDGIHCLNELSHIEFLEFNETDPRTYFVNHTI